MSSTHTPGPWELHTPDEGDPKTGDGTFCITASVTGMVIADAQPSDWYETPANARLIAAAPDLLVAAKIVQKAGGCGLARRDALLDAAIAKAEGGA